MALVAFLPATLVGQVIRGRVLDPTHQPIIGALVELRDDSGKSLQTVVTSPTGLFQLTAPAPGRYRYRVAAIGFQPRGLAPVDVTAAGVTVPDIVLATMVLRLPDLVAMGRGRYCGARSPSDSIFERLLESAHSALQIIETTIKTHQVAFQVARITTRTLYGTFSNVEVADTTVQPLTAWPVQSIDPDTLRVVGFGRTLTPGDENTREYYGPDARVLFSDWFLESHCFTVDKPRKTHPTDSLHLRFAPARKTKLIDVAGELVLDARDLALLQFSFTLKNLPGWMPEDAAGGEMQFSRTDAGLWMTKSWAIWAPVTGVSPFSDRLNVAGQMETYGWVTRVFAGDSVRKVAPR